MIPYPTFRQSQVDFHLLLRNGMAILNFVNMSKNMFLNPLSLILRIIGEKLTQLMRSIFFLKNMSKLKYIYYRVIKNAFKLFGRDAYRYKEGKGK